jgi:predicted RNA-binding Zn-ribbon protein involved in translation (DUF1610 family)
MSSVTYRCPNCKEETLSIEKGESVSREGLSQEQLDWFKSEIRLRKKAIAHLKNYLFWRCPNCKVYYITNLEGHFITKIPIKEV